MHSIFSCHLVFLIKQITKSAVLEQIFSVKQSQHGHLETKITKK